MRFPFAILAAPAPQIGALLLGLFCSVVGHRDAAGQESESAAPPAAESDQDPAESPAVKPRAAEKSAADKKSPAKKKRKKDKKPAKPSKAKGDQKADEPQPDPASPKDSTSAELEPASTEVRKTDGSKPPAVPMAPDVVQPLQNLPAPRRGSASPPPEKKPQPSARTPKTPPPSSPPPSSPPAKKPDAITDPHTDDADYALQGEYMGYLQGWWRGAERMALQVVALGDGNFEARMLRGGLPGAGWDRQTHLELTGTRQGNELHLEHSHYEVHVRPDAAVIHDREGRVLAELTKWLRVSPTLGAAPPPHAIVLFDGHSTEAFENASLTPEGHLSVGGVTKMPVGDFTLHLEFRTPFMPAARGQARGNSGVYIQQRYEVQILDSFGLEGVENECGGLYKQQRPEVNMCLPPLAWQTYDITFTASRWDRDGNKIAPARITVLHNGVPIHDHYAFTAKTGGGKAEGPERLPILLQNHGNPVVFRNVWLVPHVGLTHTTSELCW